MKLEQLPTPCYVIQEDKLKHNLEILRGVMERTGCHILLAQKCFSAFACYPLIGKYLSGTTASGLYEARLGAEEMDGEVHVFSAAYREDEFEELCRLCDHILFNSCNQVRKFGPVAKAAGVSIGLRLNPQCSTQEGHEIYDPCAPGSRLGVTLEQLQQNEDIIPMLDGMHFHTLCEQNSDALAITLNAVEEQFGKYLKSMKWINFGGGHHITREDYDIALLEQCILHMKETYDAEIYLEPGEAVALNAGLLATTVLDTMYNSMDIAILDTSAACHMPDVIEMPYRPPLQSSGMPQEKAYTYRLGGPTCLSGDVIGDYSFDAPLEAGQRLYFEDMAIYSMVKNNTFNGMALPAIAIQHADGDCEIIRTFGYEDFKMRLS